MRPQTQRFPATVSWLPFALLGSGCSVALVDQADTTSEFDIEAAASSPPAASSASLKLATWNLQWLNRADGAGPVPRDADAYARLAEYADRIDADIVALQEVDGPEAAERLFDPARYSFHFAARGGLQRVGFAFKRQLPASPEPDYAQLALGDLRSGAVLRVQLSDAELTLLAIHLKSGCFDASLTTPSEECSELGEQQTLLEAWIDARAGDPFVVLGDFNRRLFASMDDEFWTSLDDGNPAGLQLFAPTSQGTSQCWDGEFPDFIDHFVLSGPAIPWLPPHGLQELVFDAQDTPLRDALSDHCPLSISLRVD